MAARSPTPSTGLQGPRAQKYATAGEASGRSWQRRAAAPGWQRGPLLPAQDGRRRQVERTAGRGGRGKVSPGLAKGAETGTAEPGRQEKSPRKKPRPQAGVMSSLEGSGGFREGGAEAPPGNQPNCRRWKRSGRRRRSRSSHGEVSQTNHASLNDRESHGLVAPAHQVGERSALVSPDDGSRSVLPVARQEIRNMKPVAQIR